MDELGLLLKAKNKTHLRYVGTILRCRHMDYLPIPQTK